MKLFGPADSKASITLVRRPVISAAMRTTTETPTATPRTVSTDRSLFAVIASRAMPRPSTSAARPDAGRSLAGLLIA